MAWFVFHSRRRTSFANYLIPLVSVGLCGTPGLRAQAVNFGIKAGVPMTEYFDTGSISNPQESAVYTSATRRYTFGLSGELRLPNRPFGLEIDALYHRMGYNAAIQNFNSATGLFNSVTFNVAGNTWDFPIMVKYRFGHVIHPYLVGGAVIRWIASARETGVGVIGNPYATEPAYSIGTNDISDLRKSVYPGVTLGGGVEAGVLRFRVLPEIRYTRWTANISGPGGLLRFDPNQAEFLVGFSF